MPRGRTRTRPRRGADGHRPPEGETGGPGHPDRHVLTVEPAADEVRTVACRDRCRGGTPGRTPLDGARTGERRQVGGRRGPALGDEQPGEHGADERRDPEQRHQHHREGAGAPPPPGPVVSAPAPHGCSRAATASEDTRTGGRNANSPAGPCTSAATVATTSAVPTRTEIRAPSGATR